MPPVSLPPSAARGQVWTDSIATDSFIGASRGHPHVQHVLGRGAEAVLVGLLAAEEVEDREAAVDRVADDVGQQHDAGSKDGARGVEAGVVEADAARVLEAEERGHRLALELEEPETRPAGGGEAARGGAEEA